MKKNQIICYVADKSPGHIISCLTLAQEELKKNPHTQILFFTNNKKHAIAMAYTDIISWLIPLPLKQETLNHFFGLFFFIFSFCTTLCKVFVTLIKYRPAYVVATEGFLAVPVVICARFLAIPVYLYTLNVQPGKIITFLTKWFYMYLHICFDETKLYFPKQICHKVSYPVRFFTIKQVSQEDALQQLGFSTKRKTLAIFSGSQEINELLYHWIINNQHLHSYIQIIHQTGMHTSLDWKTFYAQHTISAKVYQFDINIALHYAAADLIICRSGIGTLSEVLFFGKKCITIPREKGAYQLTNALTMQKKYDDLFTVVRQKQIENNPHLLGSKITKLLQLHAIKDKVISQSQIQM